MQAPDAAWVQFSRLEKLSQREKEQFIPLCPDFVIEAGLFSDEVSNLRAKMQEYLSVGLRLEWLTLPALTQMEVYTAAGVEVLSSPQTLSADAVPPRFTLELASIWNPPF